MQNTIKCCYQKLSDCLNELEQEVIHSLSSSSLRSPDCNYEVEKAKDYHYKEIYKNITNIKHELDDILKHNNQLSRLEQLKELDEEDKKRYSYVKEKVRIFSRSESNLTALDAKEKRKTMENPHQVFTVWKQLLKDTGGNLEVTHRTAQNRKKKKIVSSTVDFLEDGELEAIGIKGGVIKEEEEEDEDYCQVYSDHEEDEQESEDNCDDYNDDEAEPDRFKPRVVDVIYKTSTA